MISHFMAIMRWLYFAIRSWLDRVVFSSSAFRTSITMDTGERVSVGPKIAEGGFSFVYRAQRVADDGKSGNRNRKQQRHQQQYYALKRIRCADAEILNACRHEAAVHRSCDHVNLMPLLGMTIQTDGGSQQDFCYMLFPLMKHSLRAEVNHRFFSTAATTTRKERLTDSATAIPSPWHETTVLQIFLGIVRGVRAMHAAGYSHRDIKLENVLFRNDSSSCLLHPVLMDFGSAGPVKQAIPTRRLAVNVAEDAAQHTTISYRPPELFEGGIRAGDVDVDYTAVDVWSLGCCLFAMMYGASPSECEFLRSGPPRMGPTATAPVRIVDCTQLKVLAGLPKPPQHLSAADWYCPALWQLLEEMMIQDRTQRLSLSAVVDRVEQIIIEQGGRVNPEYNTATATKSSYEDDVDDADIAIGLLRGGGMMTNNHDDQ